MDAGDRGNLLDVTVLRLHVDSEGPSGPASGRSRHDDVTVRRASLIRWGWITTLLVPPGGALVGVALLIRHRIGHGASMLVVGTLLSVALWALLHQDPARLSVADVERSVRSRLAGELLGRLRVETVSCALETDSHARCVADLFDKSGVGPIRFEVLVSVDHDTGEYVWRAQ
jgi:hypothetical protein